MNVKKLFTNLKKRNIKKKKQIINRKIIDKFDISPDLLLPV